jgi:hypothetical protein
VLWQVLELHYGRDGLLKLDAAGRITFLVGYVGGHGCSREELSSTFLLALYTASRTWKQQAINFVSLDPRRECRLNGKVETRDALTQPSKGKMTNLEASRRNANRRSNRPNE